MNRAVPARSIVFVLLAFVIGLLLIGCGSTNSPRDGSPVPDGELMGAVKLTSPAFSEGDSIPIQFTCEGENVSPRLVPKNVADTAGSLAIILDDPDAPGGTFVHWLLWNIPPDVKVLPGALPRKRTLPSLGDAHQGTNGFDAIGYGGPCPPPGSTHRYRFQLYVLENPLALEPGARASELRKAMRGALLDRSVLTVRFSR